MKSYKTLKKVIKSSDWTADELSKSINPEMNGSRFCGIVNGKYKGDFSKKQKLQLACYLERSVGYLFRKE